MEYGPTHIRQLSHKMEQYRDDTKAEMWEIRCRLQDEMQTLIQDWQQEYFRLQYRVQGMEQQITQMQAMMGDMNFDGTSGS